MTKRNTILKIGGGEYKKGEKVKIETEVNY